MSFNQITPQIWVGSEINNPLDPADLTVFRAMAAEANPTRIIDCRLEYDDQQLLVSAGWFMANNYLWNGIKDWDPVAGVGFQPIPDSFFSNGLNFWNQFRTDPKEIIYVHCTQGINRSVTLVYAFLLVQGMSRIEAIVQLNTHRLKTGLSDFIDFPWRTNAEHALVRLG